MTNLSIIIVKAMMSDQQQNQYYVPPPQVLPCYNLHSQQPVVPPVLLLVMPMNGVYIPSDGFAPVHYYTPVDPNIPMMPPPTPWQLPQALVAPGAPVPFVHPVAYSPPPWVPPLVPSFYGNADGDASKCTGTKTTRPKKKKTARADATRVSLKRSLAPSAHERYAAFAIQMDGIASGTDVRNSIMVRNIPSK